MQSQLTLELEEGLAHQRALAWLMLLPPDSKVWYKPHVFPFPEQDLDMQWTNTLGLQRAYWFHLKRNKPPRLWLEDNKYLAPDTVIHVEWQ